MHSVTALSLSPKMTEVTIFGGLYKVPREDDGSPYLADTTVLRFGESMFAISQWKLRIVDSLMVIFKEVVFL